MASKLEQLRKMTVVVADTGDIEAIKLHKPVDCTTNPTLLLKAAELPALAPIVDEAIAWGRKQAGARDAVSAINKIAASRMRMASKTLQCSARGIFIDCSPGTT